MNGLFTRGKGQNIGRCAALSKLQRNGLSDSEQEADENKNIKPPENVAHNTTEQHANRCNDRIKTLNRFAPQTNLNDSSNKRTDDNVGKIPPVEECYTEDMTFHPVNHKYLVG